MDNNFAPCDTKSRVHTFSTLHHISSLIWGLSALSVPRALNLIVMARKWGHFISSQSSSGACACRTTLSDTNTRPATQSHNVMSTTVFTSTAPAYLMLHLVLRHLLFFTAVIWTFKPPLLNYGHFNCDRQGSISIASWVAMAMFL